MSAGVRVGAFAALLVAIFAAAALAGNAIGPDGGGPPPQDPHASDTHGARAGGAATSGGQAGLASAQDGYRLVPSTRRFTAGRAATFAFRVLDDRGATVRAFETEQARRMHLIVVRRDLHGYQHLHPTQDAGGNWTIALTLPVAGVYRAFADFRIDGRQRTLGVDLFVPGSFAPRDIPVARTTALVDGYAVALREQAGELGFRVSRDGDPVTDLQPYLGAYGHLVVLREGDLAYRHVHPISAPAGEIAFQTGALQAARYRIFVQFRHANRVHTAAFTLQAAG